MNVPADGARTPVRLRPYESLTDRVIFALMKTATALVDNRRYLAADLHLGQDQDTMSSRLGPYYLPDQAIRRDIREDRQGVPVRLRIRTLTTGTLQPLAGAKIDIWHSDAAGQYSGFRHPGRNRIAIREMTRENNAPVESSRFLRGRQITDENGVVEFDTIVPGWYAPRTLHIHCRVLLGERPLLATEFYVPDDVTTDVLSQPPYDRRGPNPFSNRRDIALRMFKGSPGSWPEFTRTDTGYLATVTVHVQQ